MRRLVLLLVVLVGAVQLVPYGWSHPNPAETSPVVLADPTGAEIFEAACADCHTNRTDWPPYAYVAPMSWLVRRDVEAGRRAFNLSEWDESEADGDDAADEVEDGDMPPAQYRLAHPDARLSSSEKAQLIEALEQLDDPRDDDNSGPG
jgi:mono/diheme cytochrome c family protein